MTDWIAEAAEARESGLAPDEDVAQALAGMVTADGTPVLDIWEATRDHLS
ncbi:hypothetical protein [Streptomyces bohaiensis]